MPVLRYGPGVVAVLLLAAGCAPGDGQWDGPATDWSLKARVGYQVDVDLNRDLEPGERELLLSNALNAGLVLDAETKRSLFSADLGIAARYFIGEDQTLSGTGRVDPRLTLRAAHRGKRTTISSQASLSAQSTEVSQVEDTGITDQDITQFNSSLGFTIAHTLDGRNQISVGLNGNLVAFSEDADGLSPTQLVGATLGWRRALTETSTLNLTGGLRHFLSDDVTQTRSQTLDVSAGLSHRRTSRHTFNITLGSTLVRTIEKALDGDPVLTLGLTGGAGLNYTLKNFRTGIDLTQSIEPSAVGALQSFTRINGSVGYDITPDQAISLALAFARRAPISGDEDTLETLTLGPVYSLQLDPSTRLSLSYVFRLSRDETDGLASGHRVLLSVNRDFALLD